MSTIRIELDAELERLVAARVEESGQPREVIVAAALRRGLGGGRLRAILDAGRFGTADTDEQALEIATTEVSAARRERRGA